MACYDHIFVYVVMYAGDLSLGPWYDSDDRPGVSLCKVREIMKLSCVAILPVCRSDSPVCNICSDKG